MRKEKGAARDPRIRKSLVKHPTKESNNGRSRGSKCKQLEKMKCLRCTTYRCGSCGSAQGLGRGCPKELEEQPRSARKSQSEKNLVECHERQHGWQHLGEPPRT